MKKLNKICLLLLVIIVTIFIIFYFKEDKKVVDGVAKTETKDTLHKEVHFYEPEYDSRYIKNIENIQLNNDDIKNKYQFVFISDLHLSCINENEEDDTIRKTLRERNAYFYGDEDSSISKNTFKEIIDYTNNKNATALLLGGDIIDAPADSSIETFKENMSNLKTDYLYTFGNHDWSFSWNYQTEESKKEYIPKLKELVKDPYVSYLEYEDLIILAINSSTNQIEEECLDDIEKVLEKKKPTIVMMHVPIATEEIAKESLERRNRISAIGDDGGIEPSDSTQKAFDMIFSDKYKVFYILSGHVHFKIEADLNDKIHEYVTGPAFSGEINVIKIN